LKCPRSLRPSRYFASSLTRTHDLPKPPHLPNISPPPRLKLVTFRNCHDFRWFSPLFLSKSQAPTHLTSLNHDMFPHSLSYLISCPISLILSFIFFRSFRSEGELGHLGLLGLETFWPMGRQYRGLSILEQYRHPLQGSRPKPWQSPVPRPPASPPLQRPPRSPTTAPNLDPTQSSPPRS